MGASLKTSVPIRKLITHLQH